MKKVFNWSELHFSEVTLHLGKFGPHIGGVAAWVKGVYHSMWELKVVVVPEIYIMNGMIVLRLLSDAMLTNYKN